mmetsp:Transcript_101479/g.293586  ORF Transcript_101479/g.293586 Transcript_101479/m.293586 type:complete len:202 (-) Transcript_101479:661-1266(-)
MMSTWGRLPPRTAPPVCATPSRVATAGPLGGCGGGGSTATLAVATKAWSLPPGAATRSTLPPAVNTDDSLLLLLLLWKRAEPGPLPPGEATCRIAAPERASACPWRALPPPPAARLPTPPAASEATRCGEPPSVPRSAWPPPASSDRRNRDGGEAEAAGRQPAKWRFNSTKRFPKFRPQPAHNMSSFSQASACAGLMLLVA